MTPLHTKLHMPDEIWVPDGEKFIEPVDGTDRPYARTKYTRTNTHTWQPIATAPRDEFILVCEFRQGDDPDDYRSGVAVAWVEKKGWAIATNDADDEMGITYANFEPTHWQPLPLPPKPEETK